MLLKEAQALLKNQEEEVQHTKDDIQKTEQKISEVTKEIIETHREATSFLQRVDKLHETGALYARRERIFRQLEGSPALKTTRNHKY